jgi:hypothetical protein
MSMSLPLPLPKTTKEFAKYLRDLAEQVDRIPDAQLTATTFK